MADKCLLLGTLSDFVIRFYKKNKIKETCIKSIFSHWLEKLSYFNLDSVVSLNFPLYIPVGVRCFEVNKLSAHQVLQSGILDCLVPRIHNYLYYL